MTETFHELELAGCAPTPLAHYLKALGVLRLVSEQIPGSRAQGWWENDTFRLRSSLDRDGLIRFFLDQYSPTPLIAPWNGGSGFYPKDNRTALESILATDTAQFARLQTAIRNCQTLLERQGLTEKPRDEEKPRLLQICRNTMTDELLPWLDAAYLLTAEGPKYPPLLGTGGNDGRLEFTNNYMQHLLAILPGSAHSNNMPLLSEALFNETASVRHTGTIGQFDPGNLGGPNNGTGFDGPSTVNSWDYVLMLEGALAFAAASVKKLEESQMGTLAYPFCVRPAGVGYESASLSDEGAARSEMWLPLWQTPASFSTISVLLAEGRVETNRRRAKNGVDFARAISTLGVDRGISQFQRYGFHQRNGLAFLAVPLGRFDVRAQSLVEELLAPLDHWLARFRRAASNKNAPAAAGRALRTVEAAIFKLCQRPEAAVVQQLLMALGAAEATIAQSTKLQVGEKGGGLTPVPLLGPEWVLHARDDSSEFRLAAALASVWHETIGPIRKHLEPVNLEQYGRGYARWQENADSPSLVWTGGDLVRNLNAVLRRRLIEITQHGKAQGDIDFVAPLSGKFQARLEDITAFINGKTDDRRIQDLFRGLILINWKTFDPRSLPRNSSPAGPPPEAAYSLFKLCHLDRQLEDRTIRLQPQIIHRALAGDSAGATQMAVRRLFVSGFPTAVSTIFIPADRLSRITAALMFPISDRDENELARSIFAQHKREQDRDELEVTATSKA